MICAPPWGQTLERKCSPFYAGPVVFWYDNKESRGQQDSDFTHPQLQVFPLTSISRAFLLPCLSTSLPTVFITVPGVPSTSPRAAPHSCQGATLSSLGGCSLEGRLEPLPESASSFLASFSPALASTFVPSQHFPGCHVQAPDRPKSAEGFPEASPHPKAEPPPHSNALPLSSGSQL